MKKDCGKRISNGKNRRLILASSSPRRAELIRGVAEEFEGLQILIIPSNAQEVILPNETPAGYALRVSCEKAQEVFLRLETGGGGESDIVLGCDTIVVLNGKIYGKPKDKNDAVLMLRELCGHTHEVITAVTLLDKYKIVQDFEKSTVTFGAFCDKIVYTYVESGSPLDKAGGYGLQDGLIKPLITKVEGDFNNIIGLPVKLVNKILRENFLVWH